MSIKRWTGLCILGLTCITAVIVVADGLSGIEWLIDKRYDVPVTTVDVAQSELANDPGGWLVLDVREPEEYAVSHLPGAVRVPPDADVSTIQRIIGTAAPGKQVLFYCSVGQRSSKLAARVRESILEAGATNVSNLRGGIFRWYAEHGELVNADGPVDRIHPYNALWGQLIPRENPPGQTTDDSDRPE